MSLFRKASSEAKDERVPIDLDRDGRKLFSEDIVAFVKSEAEKRRTAQQSLEWQWCLNSNFLNGNQYCEINPHSGGVQQLGAETDFEERQAFNRIAPIIETRMANLNTLRYGMVVNPRTDELDDDKKAKVSTNILRYLMSVTDFPRKRKTLTSWAELCGTAFVMSYWDAGKGESIGRMAVDDGPAIELREGDVDYILLTPYEVLPESLYEQDVCDQHSIIVERVLKAADVERLYGIEIKGEEIDAYAMTPVESGMAYGDFVTSFAMKPDKVEDAVKVWIYYEKQNSTYPNGRMAIVCGDNLVHYSELPYEEIPLVAVKCKEVPGQFFGRSCIQDMIPLQRSYNGCKNKTHDYIKTIAANPMMVPEGSVRDIDELIENGVAPGSILEYDPSHGKPEPYEYASLPGEVSNECAALVQEMEYVAGVSSLMVYGKAPSGVSSGTALDTLRQIDNTRMSITGDNLRDAVKNLAKQWLRLYKRYATGYRVSAISGSNDAGAVFTWCADDINSFDIEFDTENELKRSPDAQKQAFIDALNAGAFGPAQEMPNDIRRKIREVLGVGGFAGVLTVDDVQTKHAQNENAFFGRGIPPKIDELDEDDIHISEHTKYALQRDFEVFENSDKEYANLMRIHIADHKKQKVLKAMRQQQEMQAFMPPTQMIGGR